MHALEELLQSCANNAGALVRYNGGFHRVADPLRHQVDGLLSLPNAVGSPLDKVNVGVFRLKTLLSSVEATLAKEETTTLQRLRVGTCPFQNIWHLCLQGQDL